MSLTPAKAGGDIAVKICQDGNLSGVVSLIEGNFNIENYCTLSVAARNRHPSGSQSALISAHINGK